MNYNCAAPVCGNLLSRIRGDIEYFIIFIRLHHYNGEDYCFCHYYYYVAAKATYIRLLHGKIGILEGFFGPSSVHRVGPYSAWMKYVVHIHLYIP